MSKRIRLTSDAINKGLLNAASIVLEEDCDDVEYLKARMDDPKARYESIFEVCRSFFVEGLLNGRGIK